MEAAKKEAPGDHLRSLLPWRYLRRRIRAVEWAADVCVSVEVWMDWGMTAAGDLIGGHEAPLVALVEPVETIRHSCHVWAFAQHVRGSESTCEDEKDQARPLA